eukprot:CAMPEP_0197909250 /NCGR_PEP_ID=MMETSP1439-20131203/68497_1 /TAXON_ID=66791 /ORGANISM="Gonyaulax spinifera, Strain CCMP409" /LENGTH=114 /DNA_ID=CAMNT_0043530809 /DNA_START=43 /DNA_END=383 /DNA_ORIENTATION=+
MASASCAVRVVSKTWARDRGDLFDFEADPGAEASEFHEQAFVVSESTACLRSGANVQVLPQEQATSSGSAEVLVKLTRQGSSLVLEQAEEAASVGLRPSLIVKDLPGGGHELRG